MEPVDTRRVYRLLERLMMKVDGDATLAFDPQSLAVHQLNETLATVAERLDGVRTTEELVVACSVEWGVSLDAAAEQVYRSLQILHDEGLIEASE